MKRIIIILAIAAILMLLTKNFTVAISVGIGLMAPTSLLFFLKKSLFEGLLPKAIAKLAVFDRFYNFIYGIFDLTAVVYFASIIVFFVFLTVQTLEKKRWS